ncbi:MAG: TatD family hydrolase [Dehalococcoidia bacterium]|nr:TatD family hydrolase [Dehalococcoidia bacterium]
MAEQILLGDCHTHLDQYPLAEMPEILDRARESGVAFAVCAGTTLQSTQNCIDLAEMYEPLYAGVGIHPMEANDPVDEKVYAELERMAKSSSKVVCISEVGLDYLPASPDHDTQDQVFRQHIRLARSLKLPVVFHSRESHPAVFKVLREENANEVGGAMHYFQGDEATAREAIDCGFYISLARPLIRLPELQEVAKIIPLENIVLETDAAPQPFKKYRTNWTEPRHVQSVAQTLAEIKGIPVEEVARATTVNLARMLRLERLI